MTLDTWRATVDPGQQRWVRYGSTDGNPLPEGGLPAIDRLIELGITDPERVAVTGQSCGGFSFETYVSMTQGEEAFTALTRLVCESPANLRDMWREIFAWLNHHHMGTKV